jgi:hypothetical protein
MATYLFAYKGGGVPATEEERQAVMAAWGSWFGTLGEAIVDGGNPFGPAATVSAGGAVSDGAPSSLTGYSVMKADDLAAASELAKGCPVLAAGGSVEVYETHPVM